MDNLVEMKHVLRMIWRRILSEDIAARTANPQRYTSMAPFKLLIINYKPFRSFKNFRVMVCEDEASNWDAG